jgi:hypothetical protein
MKRVLPFALAIAALLSAPAGVASEPSLVSVAQEWTLRFDDAGDDVLQDRVFHAASREVTVDCRARYEPTERMLRLEGVYRTTQVLHPHAQLAYHLLGADGRMVRFEGTRSDWTVGPDGAWEARFAIEQSLETMPGLRPALRVRFDYIVEHEFWYCARFPELELPELTVLCPSRKADFDVQWTWLPPLMPAGTVCWFPASIGAKFRDGPVPYAAAADVLAGEESTRIEAPRLPLSLVRNSEKLILYRLDGLPAGSVRIRPGFVWDGVEWFGRFAGNPYREVRVVGPLVYSVGLTLSWLGLWWAARRLSRVSAPWRRRSGYAVVVSLALVLLGIAAVSFQLLFVAGVALIWLLQRQIEAPGPRAYWTTWLFLTMLELYWGQSDIRTGGLWIGTVLSISLAALVLLPLRWIKRPVLASWTGAGIAFVAALTAMAMAVYYDFFHDYPGLRDLLYTGQLDDAGASVAALVEQRHLVPWWWWLCSVGGLAAMRIGGARRSGDGAVT